jgi:NADH-quinone oxidoreductase subunit D
MYVYVGGLRQDAPDGWFDRVSTFTADLRHNFECVGPYLSLPEVVQQFTGVGVLTHELAVAHGASGAVGRASGINVDLRRDAPYAAYAHVRELITVGTGATGDVITRLELVREQVRTSLELIDASTAALANLDGPVNVPLPKTLRAPEGIHYGWNETPLGIGGYLVVSQGERTPWRVKLRTPSFAHADLLGRILIGQEVANLGAILSSMFIITGDCDR